MLISEARRLCPDLVLRNGEDLTRFRDVSKRLWTFLRAHAWSRRVERLGLDEVFLDVTDVIAYNRETLNPHALSHSFFQLDRADPVKGFAFDGTRFYGCVWPSEEGVKGGEVQVDVGDPLCVRLMLASHLAGYLRQKLDEDFGYTSSGGVSTNKLLAKLAGSVNKPNNQTTLLATSSGDGQDVAGAFMDAHGIRKVPGIGSRIAQLIEEHMRYGPTERRDRYGDTVTVGEVRLHEGMSADVLEKILDRPGAERGGGEKIWGFLHGVDGSEVKEASDVPTQISIENTYMSRPLQTPAEVVRELCALATSLVRRMRVDLTAADAPRWLAHPKTLRLSTRTKPKQTQSSTTIEVQNFSRSSRSTPLPNFVFQLSSSPSPSDTTTPPTRANPPPFTSTHLTPSCEELAERLVTESLLPLFRRLHPERNGGWNLALLNVCATNMVAIASDAGPNSGSGSGLAPGRDIGRMFRTQEDTLRQWTVYDTSLLHPATEVPSTSSTTTVIVVADEAGDRRPDTDTEMVGEPVVLWGEDEVDDDDDEDNIWEDQEETDSQRCPMCERVIPAFAISAHERFHAMDDE